MKRPACSLFLLALTLSARAATPAPDQLLSGDVLGVFTIPDYAREEHLVQVASQPAMG